MAHNQSKLPELDERHFQRNQKTVIRFRIIRNVPKYIM
jgi:hypothetical protein